LVIVLVKQVLLADPLGENRSQLGRQVGRIDVDGERNRR
jgi:predicted RNA-binding protein